MHRRHLGWWPLSDSAPLGYANGQGKEASLTGLVTSPLGNFFLLTAQTDNLMPSRRRQMVTSCDLGRSWIGRAQMKRWPLSKRWWGSWEDCNTVCLWQAFAQSLLCLEVPESGMPGDLMCPSPLLCRGFSIHLMSPASSARPVGILEVVPYTHLCLGKTWGWRKGESKGKHAEVCTGTRSPLPLYVGEYGKQCQWCH